MFKTLDESIAKEKPAVQARIIANGDKLAAKRDAAVKAAKEGSIGVATKVKTRDHACA